MHRNTVYAALDRSEQIAIIGGIVLLDPARAQRKDATPLSTMNAIQGFWASATLASPDKRPIAVVDDRKGHARHSLAGARAGQIVPQI